MKFLIITAAMLISALVYLPKAARASLDEKYRLRNPTQTVAMIAADQVREIDMCMELKHSTAKDVKWKATRLRCGDLKRYR